MGIMKRYSGFTLIELMIVVAVIGILAGIAYPSYSEYVKKGRRSDAKAGLMSLQLEQEKFRSSCTQYAAGLAAAYVCDTATPANNRIVLNPATSPDGHYALTISNSSATTYTLTATRVAAGLQSGDKCGDFRIDQDSVKSVLNAASGYDAAKCW